MGLYRWAVTGAKCKREHAMGEQRSTDETQHVGKWGPDSPSKCTADDLKSHTRRKQTPPTPTKQSRESKRKKTSGSAAGGWEGEEDGNRHLEAKWDLVRGVDGMIKPGAPIRDAYETVMPCACVS